MLTASSLLLVPNEGTSTSPGKSAPKPLLFLLRRAMLPLVLGGIAPWRGGKGSVMAALRRTLDVFVVSALGGVVSCASYGLVWCMCVCMETLQQGALCVKEKLYSD